MAEKMRVHILAKELGVASKAVLTKCAAEGLPVKNHMTALGPGLEATIREWFTEGSHATTMETAERVDLGKVRTRRKKKAAEDGAGSTATQVAEPDELDTIEDEEAAADTFETTDETLAPTTVTETADAAATVPAEAPSADMPVVGELPAETLPPEPAEPEPGLAPQQVERPAAAEAPAEQAAVEPEPAVEPAPAAGPQNIPAPAKLQGPRVVRYEAPDRDYVAPPPRSPRRQAETTDVPDEVFEPGDADKAGRKKVGTADAKKKKGQAARRGGTRGSDVRAMEKLKEWRDQDLIERQERLAGATGRRMRARRAAESKGGQRTSATERKSEATVHEPIILKELCSALGIPFIKLVQTLNREYNIMATINSPIPNDIAELLAVETGIELTIVKARTQLDTLREEFAERKPAKLVTRPPVVTFLGHVDHGKTSLLDRIRRSRVASGEDGGITQHIGSYHYKRDNISITFLDTPGHAAFTAMRARGANVTDIVVLIVAADDGIMPQTVEAINHAKAAEVPVVVAITKIDLGVFNQNKVFGQLVEQGLTPSGNWGGEVDVFETSAVSGKGIDELLQHLSALAEVLELKADPTGDPFGTVLEAETKEGVGAVAQVLVQGGTLRPGNQIVCGNAFGKVRALLDDAGNRINAAGPSTPCEVWGLDEVPSAGDQFFGLKNAQRAKLIAEEVRHRRIDEARIGTQKARTLEDIFKQRDSAGVAVLNLVVRADVDGSVDALKHALEQLPSDKVKLIFRHTGVGGVTDSDVLLADASDAIVVAFRVAPTTTTRRLAEEHGVSIKEYKVIYNVVEDIIKAMEGLLAPEERRETRGAAQVRNVFRISKVGMIAGSYVTDGVVSRNHRTRLIREGVVIRDKCKIDSLKRFKDDVKEVRQGMECGIRLEGFDDLKEGDIIEAFEIIEIAQTL